MNNILTSDKKTMVQIELTQDEAAKNFAEATLKTLLNSTVQWEKHKAAEAAVNSISPIEINP
jgi:hypothetical protein